jgi:hypothetical protein
MLLTVRFATAELCAMSFVTKATEREVTLQSQTFHNHQGQPTQATAVYAAVWVLGKQGLGYKNHCSVHNRDECQYLYTDDVSVFLTLYVKCRLITIMRCSSWQPARCNEALHKLQN